MSGNSSSDDLAEIGLTHMSAGRYADGVAAFRKALELEAAWGGTGDWMA